MTRFSRCGVLRSWTRASIWASSSRNRPASAEFGSLAIARLISSARSASARTRGRGDPLPLALQLVGPGLHGRVAECVHDPHAAGVVDDDHDVRPALALEREPDLREQHGEGQGDQPEPQGCRGGRAGFRHAARRRRPPCRVAPGGTLARRTTRPGPGPGHQPAVGPAVAGQVVERFQTPAGALARGGRRHADPLLDRRPQRRRAGSPGIRQSRVAWTTTPNHDATTASGASQRGVSHLAGRTRIGSGPAPGPGRAVQPGEEAFPRT